jgi:hypothetical protein
MSRETLSESSDLSCDGCDAVIEHNDPLAVQVVGYNDHGEPEPLATPDRRVYCLDCGDLPNLASFEGDVCDADGCTWEWRRSTPGGQRLCSKHYEAVSYRPPHDDAAPWTPVSGTDWVERRVCPNCRNYFDTGADSDAVFCGRACRRRHERGEWP